MPLPRKSSRCQLRRTFLVEPLEDRRLLSALAFLQGQSLALVHNPLNTGALTTDVGQVTPKVLSFGGTVPSTASGTATLATPALGLPQNTLIVDTQTTGASQVTQDLMNPVEQVASAVTGTTTAAVPAVSLPSVNAGTPLQLSSPPINGDATDLVSLDVLVKAAVGSVTLGGDGGASLGVATGNSIIASSLQIGASASPSASADLGGAVSLLSGGANGGGTSMLGASVASTVDLHDIAGVDTALGLNVAAGFGLSTGVPIVVNAGSLLSLGPTDLLQPGTGGQDGGSTGLGVGVSLNAGSGAGQIVGVGINGGVSVGQNPSGGSTGAGGLGLGVGINLGGVGGAVQPAGGGNTGVGLGVGIILGGVGGAVQPAGGGNTGVGLGVGIILGGGIDTGVVAGGTTISGSQGSTGLGIGVGVGLETGGPTYPESDGNGGQSSGVGPILNPGPPLVSGPQANSGQDRGEDNNPVPAESPVSDSQGASRQVAKPGNGSQAVPIEGGSNAGLGKGIIPPPPMGPNGPQGPGVALAPPPPVVGNRGQVPNPSNFDPGFGMPNQPESEVRANVVNHLAGGGSEDVSRTDLSSPAVKEAEGNRDTLWLPGTGDDEDVSPDTARLLADPGKVKLASLVVVSSDVEAALANEGQPGAAPLGPDLLAGFLPFDMATLNEALAQYLSQIESLGGETIGFLSRWGVYPWLIASAAGAVACVMVQRRGQGSSEASSSLAAGGDAMAFLLPPD